MRAVLFSFFVVLLLGLANAEWAERLRVQTVDNYMNPLTGVSVTITYQKQRADALDGVITGKTNGDGIFEAIVHDYVSLASGNENRVYRVRATNPFGFEEQSERNVNFGANQIGGAHLEQFQYNTTSARVNITVKDQKGKYVTGALVKVKEGLEANTDSSGLVRFGLPLGNYTASIAKETFTSTTLFELVSDMAVETVMTAYNNTLLVLATNEYGVPIPGANISFNGASAITNSSGEVLFSGINIIKGTLSGKYGGIDRSAEVTFIDENARETLVFPSSPIVIERVSMETRDPYGNCTVVIGCRARDERVSLSKITMTLSYSVDGEDWVTVPQNNELGVFQFEIGCSAPMDMSYTLTASDEYGSAQSDVYNVSIAPPVECSEGATKECTTPEDCVGVKTCAGTVWGECADVPEDGCPVVVPVNNTTDNNPTDNSFFGINIGGGGTFLMILSLLGVVAILGGLAILLMTQRERVSGFFGWFKRTFHLVGHLDEAIVKADQEYKRDKLSESYMKEGKTDEFFGLDKEEKRKVPAQPNPKPPEKPKTEENAEKTEKKDAQDAGGKKYETKG